MTRRSHSICLLLSCFVLCCACEQRQNLGDACVAPDPDASTLVVRYFSLDGAVEVAPINGRPLTRIGRVAGCVEPDAALQRELAACSDPTDLSNCFNPFAPLPDVPTEAEIEQRYGPCACLLDAPDAGP